MKIAKEDRLNMAIADFRINVLKLGKAMASNKKNKIRRIKAAIKSFEKINMYTALFDDKYSPAAEKAMIRLVAKEVEDYKLTDNMLGNILCIDSDTQPYNGTQLMGFVVFFADKYGIKLDF